MSGHTLASLKRSRPDLAERVIRGELTAAEAVFQVDLDYMEMRYRESDASKLISAVIYCGEHKVIMPEWVVQELRAKTEPWFKHDVKDLGEALGVQLPKGAHLNKLKQRARYQGVVYTRVVYAQRCGKALHNDLFDEIGSALGIGKTRAAEYYYSLKPRRTKYREQ